ncbi:ATP-binding protein, partial [Geitlerinema sp. PCC 9228]|uniref:ATP-binding protein n=1 Tax=Geitlerinema sp. PCC 9228 TaxID=111611 RepID=UPI00147E517C
MSDRLLTHQELEEAIIAANREALDEVTWTIESLQDEFVLLVLRCNYHHLRDLMRREIHQKGLRQVRELTLDRRTMALFPAIAGVVEDSQPTAVSITGLEELDNLDAVLGSANMAREELRRHFRLPLLLWADDRVFGRLVRVVPDFKSWATTTRFQLPDEALVAFLRQYCDRLFDGVLATGKFDVEPVASRENVEMAFALQDVRERDISLEPDIEASLAFARGLRCYQQQAWDEAIAHYDESLAFWEENAETNVGAFRETPFGVRAGIVRFYRGWAYQGKADWEAAKTELERGLQQFQAAGRPDLVTKFACKLGEVLVSLEAWQELEENARQWLAWHQDDAANLARDWGFLARVAAQRGQWQQVKECADAALAAWQQSPEPRSSSLPYCLLAAQARKELGNLDQAISILEKARSTTSPERDPSNYVRVLQALRDWHYAQKEYVRAFEIKQQCLAIEFQFGFRAFVGAGILQPQVVREGTDKQEPVVSGRKGDIDELANTRIPEDRYKLTVLYGPSGVGKSSLLQAGLVPALQQRPLRDRTVLPVLTRVYGNWARELGKQISEALKTYPDRVQPNTPLASVADLRAQLQRNAENRLLTVLVFDQFEEFFFSNPELETRQELYAFLQECLKGTDLQFVKVILSLREDYLHRLLELERYTQKQGTAQNTPRAGTEALPLRAEWRYYLGNFLPAAARDVVADLTQHKQQSHRKLETDLVEQFVADLTDALGEVRPVELQVVGAQLEAEEITQLAQYQQLGENPKEQLAQRWIAMVVEDCGEENIEAAWQVLAALTDEKGTRPMRTKAELEEVLADYRQLVGGKAVSLEEPILTVLVGSGLVVCWRQESENRYQLVHDYLVDLVRRKYNADYRQRLERLAQRMKQEESTRKKWQKWTLRGSVVAAVVLACLAGWSEMQRREAQRREANAEIVALSLKTNNLRRQGLEIKSLLKGLKTVQKIEKYEPKAIGETRMRGIAALRQVVYSIRAKNRLEGHQGWVNHVTFSPDGDTLASASRDGTVRLWQRDGTLIATLEGHQDDVTHVTFSP